MMKDTDHFREKRDLESIEIRGSELRPGSRVILHPRGWLEIMDRTLRDKVAIIESIEQDFEERLFVAVIVEGAGGREACNGHRACNRFFFRPDEVELFDTPKQTR